MHGLLFAPLLPHWVKMADISSMCAADKIQIITEMQPIESFHLFCGQTKELVSAAFSVFV